MAAEMAVSFAIDHLLPLLTEEATKLRGIHKGFADIKDELESIQAFLKDADRRAATDEESEGVKTWVKQVRDVAFRIEDIIDDYMIHVGQQQQLQQPGCATIICKITNLIKTLKSRHQIASEIQDIKSSVREIKDRSDRYGFQRQQEGSSSRENVKWLPNREAALYIEEAQVVGFDVPREKLIGWLVGGPAERTVISVVAMGGQGKTTLAKKVFDNRKVIDHFDCRAWITVSQSYSIEGLLRDMLRQFGNKRSDVTTMDRRELTDEVRNSLQQKRYVVMFDDVWNVLFWDEIQFAVVDNKNGSRILMTTRKMDVAVSSRISSPFVEVHELLPLTFDQSLELFYKKAFQSDFDGHCPEDLIDISHAIVKKCNGLPLAIVAIGGVLSGREKIALEWERFFQNLSDELGKNLHLDHITKILGFSYDDLPYHLKPCFLYFGMYPEDYEVGSRRMIMQWIAEGFVREERGRNLEKVGKEYLRELVRRSLVLVSSRHIIEDWCSKSKEVIVKQYSVHDVMREVILTKFKDLSFGQFIGAGAESMPVSSRRLSIATNSEILIKGDKMSSHVRSFHIFTKELDEKYFRRIPEEYTLLKVLDAEDLNCDSVPDNIGNLVHLKYLSINANYDPPMTISKLENLETLTIWGVHYVEMPKELNKLRRLRHLVGNRILLTELKDGIGDLTSLQTLERVPVEDNEVRELKKLKQLRVLGLVIKGKHVESSLCSSLNEMQQLEKLTLFIEWEDNNLNFISPLPMLRKLFLSELRVFPEWVSQLPNLVKLTLKKSTLMDDPMKSLQNMPKLSSLTLCNCYEGQSLHFEGGGFQKLEELRLESLFYLKSILIDKGALPSLKRLWLWNIPPLKILLPPGIHRLETIVVVNLQNSSVEFIHEIKIDGH